MLMYPSLAAMRWNVHCQSERLCELAFVSSQVNDISLEDYIAVKSKNAVFVPHSAGRYQKKRFRKAQCPIVERCAKTDS